MKKYTKEQAEMVLNDFKKCVGKDCQDAASTFLKTMFGLPETGLVVCEKCKYDVIVMRTGEGTGYGFNFEGYNIVDDPKNPTCWNFKNHPEEWRPATKEDEKHWKEHLMGEAERRFGRNWKTVKLKKDAEGDTGEYINNGCYKFQIDNNSIWNIHGIIFKDGKWAEIIEKEKLSQAQQFTERLCDAFKNRKQPKTVDEVTEIQKIKMDIALLQSKVKYLEYKS